LLDSCSVKFVSVSFSLYIINLSFTYFKVPYEGVV
jgi:hypothetical protein